MQVFSHCHIRWHSFPRLHIDRNNRNVPCDIVLVISISKLKSVCLLVQPVVQEVSLFFFLEPVMFSRFLSRRTRQLGKSSICLSNRLETCRCVFRFEFPVWGKSSLVILSFFKPKFQFLRKLGCFLAGPIYSQFGVGETSCVGTQGCRVRWLSETAHRLLVIVSSESRHVHDCLLRCKLCMIVFSVSCS